MPAATHSHGSHYSTMPTYSTMPGHANSNSSAFSVNAQPHEDWTQVSDLAERRRIQNRIAQRNYRKKLKRRLEDLEKRAGSNSASPEPELDSKEAGSSGHSRSTSGGQIGPSSRYSNRGDVHDPFHGQRDDGGISVQHFYQSSRPGSTAMPAYKGISTLDYPNLQAWQQYPQFANGGFVKSEDGSDLSQWYNYSGYPQPGSQRTSMEHSTSQQSWQSQNSQYSSSPALWDSTNVMLQAGSQYFAR